MRRASVDEFFEKLERNSDNGKKLVSWHGELVPPPPPPTPPFFLHALRRSPIPLSCSSRPFLRVIYIPILAPIQRDTSNGSTLNCIAGRILPRPIRSEIIGIRKSCYANWSILQRWLQFMSRIMSILRRIWTICGRMSYCTTLLFSPPCS